MQEKPTYSFDELKDILDKMAECFNVPSFIESDPIQFPRSYTLKQDIEISAFLTATITWGKRSMILKSASRMHSIMGNSPYEFIMDKGYERLGKTNIHRTFFEEDMAFICRGLNSIYTEYDSLETLFHFASACDDKLWAGIRGFRRHICDANNNNHGRSLKHISDPAASACKRLNLALKWLVRNDGIVDIGLWGTISPADLQIPLDTHVIHVAHKLGLLQRSQNDRKAVEELTATLRNFNADDPILYDFALFGLGESGILSKKTKKNIILIPSNK